MLCRCKQLKVDEIVCGGNPATSLCRHYYDQYGNYSRRRFKDLFTTTGLGGTVACVVSETSRAYSSPVNNFTKRYTPYFTLTNSPKSAASASVRAHGYIYKHSQIPRLLLQRCEILMFPTICAVLLYHPVYDTTHVTLDTTGPSVAFDHLQRRRQGERKFSTEWCCRHHRHRHSHGNGCTSRDCCWRCPWEKYDGPRQKISCPPSTGVQSNI